MSPSLSQRALVAPTLKLEHCHLVRSEAHLGIWVVPRGWQLAAGLGLRVRHSIAALLRRWRTVASSWAQQSLKLVRHQCSGFLLSICRSLAPYEEGGREGGREGHMDTRIFQSTHLAELLSKISPSKACLVLDSARLQIHVPQSCPTGCVP